MDIHKQLGLNIKRLRKERGWSQENLSFEAKLHRTYISDIERGKRNPTIAVLEKIAKAFDVTPDVLLKR